MNRTTAERRKKKKDDKRDWKVAQQARRVLVFLSLT
jgi:hypothetical protein